MAWLSTKRYDTVELRSAEGAYRNKYQLSLIDPRDKIVL